MHEIIDYWKKQRDMYKYMHDQTVNLMNKGYIGSEIAEMIELPPELAEYWPNRGYYGSLRHNARASLPALHGLVRRQSVEPRTTCRRSRRRRSTSSTWAARMRC